MKPLLLFAALLFSAASAQVRSLSTPVPVLTLSAPVGTSLELVTTTTSRTTFSNVRVTALPGSDRSADELAEIRKAVTAGIGPGARTTASGKLLCRVTGRAADGSVTLLTSTIQSEPGEMPISLEITQTVARDGRISGLKFGSDNEILNAALARYTADRLEQLADQNGYNFSGVYGQPLTPGQAYSQNHKMTISGVLSGLFSAFASQAELPELFSKVQASPLSATTITTYGGLNAQGLHAFSQNSKLSPWTVETGGVGEMSSFSIDLTGARVRGTHTYRADGLPGPSTQHTHLVMNLAIETEGVQVKVTMTANQTTIAKLP
ncbi:hypothetical protein [Deinococcus frigens]|uniref:hypothetical protein n=1 Tax=Deinococcus frigens TaxID=249403 RepID=UPI000497A2BA|nr:hypothetical protein [Deinococcus frigens]